MSAENSDGASAAIADFLAAHPAASDQLLPLLHHVQHVCGYLGESALVQVAAALNLSRAEVYGVATFYEDFVLAPRAPVVDVCAGEACQAVGAAQLYAILTEHERAQHMHARQVFCLGNCAAGPSVRVGDEIIGRATIEQILDGKPVGIER